MTEVRFKADGVTGKVAIYDYTAPNNNDNPLTAPRSNLSRLHFHSDFDYVGFGVESSVPTISTTVSISNASGFYYKNPSHNLGAHGKSGIPFVYGRIFARGVWMPLCGSIPVVVFASNTQHNLINVSLAVDDTYVYLAEQRSFNGTIFTSITPNVEVWVSEVFSS